MSVGLILCIVSGVLELFCTVFITIQAIRKPKKILYILSAFSMLTLPACICNILAFADRVSHHWNSFCYLFVTLFMLGLHFWITLDIGQNLRTKGIQWTHPLVICGLISLCCALGCLILETIMLLVRNDDFPFRPLFITGVCIAILCDGAVYLYSFSSLVCPKQHRIHDDQSRTVALGVWFLGIQSFWYMTYGVLYIWFFCRSWDDFSILLAFDYIWRYFLCLIFASPPPQCTILAISEYVFSKGMFENNNRFTFNSSLNSTEINNNQHYIHLDDPPKLETLKN